MIWRHRDRVALAWARRGIDHVDDGLIVLLAARRQLVRAVGLLKPRAGLPLRDPARERYVRVRARWLALRFGVPVATARRLVDLAIADACRQQGVESGQTHHGLDADQGYAMRLAPMMRGMSLLSSVLPRTCARLLGRLPPPSRLAPWLRVVPVRWQHALLETAMAHVLRGPLRDSSLDFMVGRRLGIEVSDLGLRWVLARHGDRLHVVDDAPEACVRGNAADLLLLAGRMEDADTLFFQRALVLTGDTELGLTARNLLERLPWETVPLGLRIALNRGARLARLARDAHRDRQGETIRSR